MIGPGSVIFLEHEGSETLNTATVAAPSKVLFHRHYLPIPRAPVCGRPTALPCAHGMDYHSSPVLLAHVLRLATRQCDVLDLGTIGLWATFGRDHAASFADGPLLRVTSPTIVPAHESTPWTIGAQFPIRVRVLAAARA